MEKIGKQTFIYLILKQKVLKIRSLVVVAKICGPKGFMLNSYSEIWAIEIVLVRKLHQWK